MGLEDGEVEGCGDFVAVVLVDLYHLLHAGADFVEGGVVGGGVCEGAEGFG